MFVYDSEANCINKELNLYTYRSRRQNMRILTRVKHQSYLYPERENKLKSRIHIFCSENLIIWVYVAASYN